MAARKGEEHKHDEAAAMDGAKMAQLSSLYFAGNLAIGDPDVPKERELATGVCYCCKVAMAHRPPDPGSPPRGLCAVGWSSMPRGAMSTPATSATSPSPFSRDGGRTFSEPARVSRRRMATGGMSGRWAGHDGGCPGVVHLVWPTVIGGDQPEGAIFYASSRDGKSFTARQRVPTLGSPEPMHPQIAATGPD